MGGSQISRGVEGGRERWSFTPQPTIPADTETRTQWCSKSAPGHMQKHLYGPPQTLWAPTRFTQLIVDFSKVINVT